ncbi:ASCH domain-containing protein [Burkholderia vietnamiensis]|uniref:ASCH domain-containing protein n=1 Tax=Burkholderia vietnamiensis TaxID=60552 RepID=UPI001FC7D30E|nr:ASCH domain-containing protein [Burkholderia vietnamiensis]WHU91005.1 ASCH domain-containing protein [Burkholderia vietnamiensis]
MNGHKDIENRTWPTRFRGRVLIHASKGMTKAEYEDAELFAEGLHLPARDELERGGIVGIATITDCVLPAHRKSVWHTDGQFGFQIADAKPLPFIECKGALGFFNVTSGVAAVLREPHAATTHRSAP